MRKRLLFFALIVVTLTACGLNAADETPAATEIPRAQRTSLDTLALQINATPTLVSPDVINAVTAEDQLLINLYQRVRPSVVNIEITQRASSFSGLDGSGSGFIYDMQGHIVTNAHVVQDAVEILVTFSDGYVTTAEVVGRDEYSDLAVIRVNVDERRLLPVELGDSDLLLVGQSIAAIGNPFGLQSSMTTGIVSATGRALPSAQLINQANQGFSNPSIIQVDAPVNPGNSGGPLLDMSGRVVGVNTAIRTESGTFQGVAFAVPVNTLKRVVPQLIENGVVQYSWLGVAPLPNDIPGFSVPALAETLNLPIDYGVLIETVTGGSPADIAGVRGGDSRETIRGYEIIVGGDIIVAIDGVQIRDVDQLLAYLVENTAPGDVITMTVVRGNETLDLEVELGVRP